MRDRSLTRVSIVVIAIVASTAALHLAEAIVVPIALAIFVAFMLAPLVSRLERRGLRTVPAVLLVVCLSFSTVGGAAWVLGAQLTSLAQELPRYRGNILRRIAEVRGAHRGTAIESVQKIAEDVAGEMKAPDGASRPAERPVPVTVEPPSILWNLPSVLATLATAGLVIVLVVFFLVRRGSLRERAMRLVGESRLALTTKALDEAGQRVTSYLVRQSMVNAVFGGAVAAGLLLIGVPYALLWGALATALRFIPYVGSWTAAAAPTLVSLAVFPGWIQPLSVLGLIVALEIVIYAGVEPWLYGRGTGISDVALLVSLAFWAWLWGPIGLLLATPITVCLGVLSKYVDGLGPLAILLEEDVALHPPALFYQRLVARAEHEAAALLGRHAAAGAREDAVAHLLAPAVAWTKRDRARGVLTVSDTAFVLDAIRRLAASLGRPIEPGARARPRIVLLPSGDAADEVALDLLAILLDATPVDARVVSHESPVAATLDLIERESPALLCIGAVPPGGLVATRLLVERLRAEFPDLPILVLRGKSGRHLAAWRDRMLPAGANRVLGTLGEARTVIGQFLTAPSLAHGAAVGRRAW